PPLHGLWDLLMRQRPFIRRRRIMITLNHLGAFPALLGQFERWLEEVHIEPCRRIEAGHHTGSLDAVEPAVSDQTPDYCAVLLLDEGLVVLLVDARSGDLELLVAAPRYDDLVHEGAVVVEVDAAQQPREQALCAFDRLDNKAAVAGDKRHALGPAGGNIHHREGLDERARDRCAPVSDHVDLAKARRRLLPVIECPDRHFATDRRVEAHAATTAAGHHELRRAEHSVNRRSTDRENSFPMARVELQPAMPLKRWRQSRDHHHEPLTAYPIRRLPQRRHRVFDRRIVLAPARGAFLGPDRLPRPVSPKRAHRMLAMPAHCGAKLVENAPLLPPPRPTVALRHRRQNLAPRAHADPSRHRHHRSDSVTTANSSARIFR